MDEEKESSSPSNHGSRSSPPSSSQSQSQSPQIENSNPATATPGDDAIIGFTTTSESGSSRVGTGKVPPKGMIAEYASRINYLYQAALQVAPMVPSLNQHYGQIMNVISEKTTAKRDFSMKRFMCKTCKAVLIPGLNMKYRLQRRKYKKSHPIVKVTCTACNTVKKFPTDPAKKLKAERKLS